MDAITTCATLAFWGAVLLLGYTYLGYPALLLVLAARRTRRAAGPSPAPPASPPRVSVVLVVHDEAARIAGRLEDLLGLDYPAGRLEILVGSDGSSDGTVALARAYEGAVIRVVPFAERRGKAAVLSDLVPQARGEIVVFADARQRYDNGAVRALVAPFADPRVGAVSGELILSRDGGATPVGEGIGLYWRYEKRIRLNESRTGSTVGATGAIYAIRRSLFEPLPHDTLLDDVLIPMRIARRGHRVLFEPGARAYDRPATTAREEFTRKVRTIAGNFQLFARQPWLLHPARNPLWLRTLSHKGLRLIGPLLLVLALVACLPLLPRPLYLAALAAQFAFYAAALAGAVLRRARRRPPLLSLPYVVCLLQWATVVAFFRFATGRQKAAWERAAV